MKKNKVIKQFNKHYLDYYLKSEKFYSYKILEGIEEKDINDYITNMLWEARKVLTDFKKITKDSNQVNLNNEDIITDLLKISINSITGTGGKINDSLGNIQIQALHIQNHRAVGQ